MADTPETFEDQLWRLHEIANGDRDCDMSENDLKRALRALLMAYDELMTRPIHPTIPDVAGTEPASALTVWQDDPYCSTCGSAICEHSERERTPNGDVPDALRNELLRVAADRHMSWYYLCAIYRQGVTDANAWTPIETAPKSRVVLVFYRKELGKGRTMRACFYPPGTLDMGDNEGEADDNGMNADGEWYEESDAYEYLMPLNGTPTHWKPLPSPPLAGNQPSTEVLSSPAASPAQENSNESDPEPHP